MKTFEGGKTGKKINNKPDNVPLNTMLGENSINNKPIKIFSYQIKYGARNHFSPRPAEQSQVFKLSQQAWVAIVNGCCEALLDCKF